MPHLEKTAGQVYVYNLFLTETEQKQSVLLSAPVCSLVGDCNPSTGWIKHFCAAALDMSDALV